MNIITRKLLILSTAVLAFMHVSCGGRQQQGNAISSADQAANNELNMTDHPGMKVYDQYCKACHMANGSGIRGMHPPLIKNRTVNGKPDRLIEVTLNGMSGRIVIDGVEYNGIMPPHNHLTDKQIADVLTWIRQNFQNDAGPITPEQVRKLR